MPANAAQILTCNVSSSRTMQEKVTSFQADK